MSQDVEVRVFSTAPFLPLEDRIDVACGYNPCGGFDVKSFVIAWFFSLSDPRRPCIRERRRGQTQPEHDTDLPALSPDAQLYDEDGVVRATISPISAPRLPTAIR